MILFIFFVFLILLLGIVYSSKGNVDIMKKDIIDKCEEINEFGDCVIQKEIQPVPEQITQTTARVGLSIANSFGVPDLGMVFAFIIIIAGFIIFGFAFLVALTGGG